MTRYVRSGRVVTTSPIETVSVSYTSSYSSARRRVYVQPQVELHAAIARAMGREILVTRAAQQARCEAQMRKEAEMNCHCNDCFDADCMCDETEKAMIECLRNYLRPQSAPDCLRDRLRECMKCISSAD